MSKFNNYIFDLDGTLINSSEEVLLCFKKAFALAKFDIDENRLNSDVIGPPLKDIIELIAPNIKEPEIESVTSYFRQIYDYDENDISKIYDGILELLHYLKQENAKLFVATLKPDIPTKRILHKFSLENFFEDIYTIDKFGEKITKEEMIKDILYKYKLDKAQTVIIGDAVSDILSGKRAGISSIAALWGYGIDKTFIINEADYNFKTAEELGEWLK